MTFKFQKKDHHLKQNIFRISFDESTRKPLKPGQNIGNVFFFANFYNQSDSIAESGLLEKKTSMLLLNTFKKLRNVKYFDLRDLCIKRGKIIRKLSIKIFFNEKITFELIKFFHRFSFTCLKKELAFAYFNKIPKQNLELMEKTSLKGLLNMNIISGIIDKINNQNLKKKKHELFLNFRDSHLIKRKKVIVRSDYSDIKFENCNLTRFLLELANNKKLSFLTIL